MQYIPHSANHSMMGLPLNTGYAMPYYSDGWNMNLPFMTSGPSLNGTVEKRADMLLASNPDLLNTNQPEGSFDHVGSKILYYYDSDKRPVFSVNQDGTTNSTQS
jgi:hypothetical protein